MKYFPLMTKGGFSGDCLGNREVHLTSEHAQKKAQNC